MYIVNLNLVKNIDKTRMFWRFCVTISQRSLAVLLLHLLNISLEKVSIQPVQGTTSGVEMLVVDSNNSVRFSIEAS